MNEQVYVESAVARPPPSLLKRVSWGAIFAGLFVAVAVQFLLSVLGIAIGAGAIDPLQDKNPTRGLGIGSGIWLLFSGLVATFTGAFTAGRLSGGPRRADGAMHGIVTWSVMTLVMVLTLVTATGAMVGGIGAILTNSLRMANPQESQKAADALGQQLQKTAPEAQVLLPTGRSEQPEGPWQLTSAAKDDPQLAAALARLQAKRSSVTDADREEVLNRLAQHNMDREQAEKLMNEWQQQVDQLREKAEQKAREIGETTARTVSTGAWWAFLGLILQVAVAAWAGGMGTGSLDRGREVHVTTGT